jgi:hypothetical protein
MQDSPIRLPLASLCWNERSDWSVGFSSAAATIVGNQHAFVGVYTGIEMQINVLGWASFMAALGFAFVLGS